MKQFAIFIFPLLLLFSGKLFAGEIYGTIKIDGILKGGIEVKIYPDKDCTTSLGESTITDDNGFYKISTDKEGSCYIKVCAGDNNSDCIEIYVYADGPVRYDLNFNTNTKVLEVK